MVMCRTHWENQSWRFLIHSHIFSYKIPFTISTSFSCILHTSSSLLKPKTNKQIYQNKEEEKKKE